MWQNKYCLEEDLVTHRSCMNMKKTNICEYCGNCVQCSHPYSECPELNLDLLKKTAREFHCRECIDKKGLKRCAGYRPGNVRI